MPDKTNAQLLRTNQTEAERQLWRQLRNRNLANYKFRRQYPIEPYIVDFCCFSHKLIIELDGDTTTKMIKLSMIKNVLTF